MKIFLHVDGLNRELEKQAGKKVVFTNGVFDIIHPGHIELLEFARGQGDLLVVGVNDDASVRRLKGGARPVFPLAERMEILAAIQFVDYVVPFSEDTPLRLIRELKRIDVLVKGGDYEPDGVVGRDEVEGSGGKLVLFPFQSHYSTSDIIRKIIENF